MGGLAIMPMAGTALHYPGAADVDLALYLIS
jgi:hypothetical protein